MVAAAVSALGHAGLRVDAPGVRLLLDPWLSGSGAFLGSWFPFPDNSHLLSSAAADPLDCDLVVVSHEHLDHLDLDLLASLPAEVPIVVPRYPTAIIQRRLRAIGRHRVAVLDAWQRLPLGDHGDWLTVIPEQCPMSHDAAVLIRVSGRAVLHTNDARISLAQVRRAMVEVDGPIDLMFVQTSGASWHPVCYEYDAADRERIETVKRVGKLKAVTRLVRGVAPRLVLPYAGPPCFLDDELFELNGGLRPGGVFSDQHDAVGWLHEHLPAQRSAYLLPGDAIDLGGLRIMHDAHWAGFSLAGPAAERRSYLEAYAARSRDAIDRAWRANPPPAADLGERFAAHLESLGLLSRYFLARIGMTLRFEVRGAVEGVWDAHIGPDGVRVDLDGGRGPADYRLSLDGRWLDGVVSGRTRWEELLLSLRFSARREPDVYNDYLVGLLKHADRAALRAVEDFESARDTRQTVTVDVAGAPVRISRYCPHAGEDLAETSVVRDGRLRCLGHNFEFDLATGECLNARCEPLMVQHASPVG